MTSTEAQKQALLRIARRAIAAGLARAGLDGEPLGNSPSASGVFVTIRHESRLRGCIGTIELRGSLGREVARCAVGAAFEDPRFPPIGPLEVTSIAVEISLLGPLEPIDPAASDAITLGRHGIVVEDGRRRGLLLPQVATEWQWDRQTFLAHACEKANLPPDAWRRGATIYRFDADVFGD